MNLRKKSISVLFLHPPFFTILRIAIIKNAEKIKDIEEIITESTRENNNKKIIMFFLTARKNTV